MGTPIRKSGKQCCAMVLVLAAMSSAIAQESPIDTLADLSLEELSNIEITSVSKRAQRLSDAPASIFVITATWPDCQWTISRSTSRSSRC